MKRLGTRYAALLRLPACVGNREADGAGPVTGGPRVLFGEEEDTVGDIAAPGDGAQPAGAVETAEDAAAAVATQRPWLSAGVRLAVGTDKYPGLAHSSPFVWCHLDILRPGHWRQQEPLSFRGNCSCKFRARHSVSCFQIGVLPPQWQSE